jgi:hypothetical protein
MSDGAPAGFYNQASATAYLIDLAGTYSAQGASAPTIDPAGANGCSVASASTLVAAGAYIPTTEATSAALEIVDRDGTPSSAGARASTGNPAPADSGPSASGPADSGTQIPGAEATCAATESSDSPPPTVQWARTTTDQAGTHSSAVANAPPGAPWWRVLIFR